MKNILAIVFTILTIQSSYALWQCPSTNVLNGTTYNGKRAVTFEGARKSAQEICRSKSSTQDKTFCQVEKSRCSATNTCVVTNTTTKEFYVGKGELWDIAETDALEVCESKNKSKQSCENFPRICNFY